MQSEGGRRVMRGSWSWSARTRSVRAELQASQVAGRTAAYAESEVTDLPDPVQRYFQSVLRNGQPMIRTARLTQQGEFLVKERPPRWGAFSASHLAAVSPPSFDWDARIAWAPGVKVFVRDAYLAGAGLLHAAAFGVLTLTRQHGTRELAEGELMRYLAETPWYPTALLPGHGVSWTAIDDSSARATLTDNATTVSLDFTFDDDGLITGVWSSARYRDVNGSPTPMPWQGRFGRYEVHSRIRIPARGEVAWVGPEGAMPYWRGTITSVSYDFQR